MVMQQLGGQAGRLWAWWKGDELPPLPPLEGFRVERERDPHALIKLMRVPPRYVHDPLNQGHHAYIAYLQGEVVAFGWSAINAAAFGSPSVSFHVPPGNRYLYYFVTLLPWRNRGIYARLLQEIIRREEADHERFWIIHQEANVASRRGIARAGFRLACNVYFLQTGGLGLVAGEVAARAYAGAQLLGLPLIE